MKKENIKIERKSENIREEIKELEDAMQSGIEMASKLFKETDIINRVRRSLWRLWLKEKLVVWKRG